MNIKRIIKKIRSHIHGKPSVANNVRNCIVGKYVRIATSAVAYDSELDDYCNCTPNCRIQFSKIGKRTSIGTNTRVNYAEIGSYCSISWNVTIGAMSHNVDRLSGHAFTFQPVFGIVDREMQEMKPDRPITYVGNDVWIGCNAVLKSGISIGNGSVIGAGAVVLNDVPPYSIVVGVPAKVIKYRFADDIINKLKTLPWWDLSDDILKENMDLFSHNLTMEDLILLEKLF